MTSIKWKLVQKTQEGIKNDKMLRNQGKAFTTMWRMGGRRRRRQEHFLRSKKKCSVAVKKCSQYNTESISLSQYMNRRL